MSASTPKFTMCAKNISENAVNLINKIQEDYYKQIDKLSDYTTNYFTVEELENERLRLIEVAKQRKKINADITSLKEQDENKNKKKIAKLTDSKKALKDHSSKENYDKLKGLVGKFKSKLMDMKRAITAKREELKNAKTESSKKKIGNQLLKLKNKKTEFEVEFYDINENYITNDADGTIYSFVNEVGLTKRKSFASTNPRARELLGLLINNYYEFCINNLDALARNFKGSVDEVPNWILSECKVLEDGEFPMVVHMIKNYTTMDHQLREYKSIMNNVSKFFGNNGINFVENLDVKTVLEKIFAAFLLRLYLDISMQLCTKHSHITEDHIFNSLTHQQTLTGVNMQLDTLYEQFELKKKEKVTKKPTKPERKSNTIQNKPKKPSKKSKRIDTAQLEEPPAMENGHNSEEEVYENEEVDEPEEEEPNDAAEFLNQQVKNNKSSKKKTKTTKDKSKTSVKGTIKRTKKQRSHQVNEEEDVEEYGEEV